MSLKWEQLRMDAGTALVAELHPVLEQDEHKLGQIVLIQGKTLKRTLEDDAQVNLKYCVTVADDSDEALMVYIFPATTDHATVSATEDNIVDGGLTLTRRGTSLSSEGDYQNHLDANYGEKEIKAIVQLVGQAIRLALTPDFES